MNSEAGATPARGQRAFNTQLDPVEWSFSTYIRPYVATGTLYAAEQYLWNALLGDQVLSTTTANISSLTRATTTAAAATLVTTAVLQKKFSAADTATNLVVEDIINDNGFVGTGVPFNEPARITAITGTTYTVEYASAPGTGATGIGTTSATTVATAGHWSQGTTATGNYSYVSTMGSNKNSLQRFALIFVVDQAVYCIENCAVDQVTIDFGLDAISTLAWTGKGTKLSKISAPTIVNLQSSLTAAAAVTTANYITNKLSTVTLQSAIGGTEGLAASTSYSVPLTGGSISIANNINYLVPTNLAIVNTPIGYYTGQRAISGNLTAYLRTGTSGDTGSLLSDILTASTSTTEPKYKLQVELGGSTGVNRVEFEMSGVVLQVPSVNVADVVATTINFAAQGFDPVQGNQGFDITKNNDLLVRYFTA